MKSLFLSALCALALVTSSRAADNKEAVEAVVRKTVDQILVVVKDVELSRAEKRKRVMTAIEPVVDFPLMAKLSLGPKHWRRIDAKRRRTFTGLFVETLKASYFEKLDLFSDERVEVEDAVQKKKKFTVVTYIVSKGERTAIAYKLYNKKGVWKVYDFEIEGVSVVRSYGSQYKEFLREGSFDELIAKMTSKIEAEKKKEKPQKAVDAKASKESTN